MTHPGITEHSEQRAVYRDICFEYTGPAIGKPRMTRRDKYSPPRVCVARWFAFKDAFILAAKQAGYCPDTDNILELAVTARFAMPRSWSATKRMVNEGEHHRSKPDCDNILKAVADALTKEDSGIYHMAIYKYWSCPEYAGLTVYMKLDRDDT